MTQIKDVMVELNPWWKGGFELEYKEREIYNQIKKYLPTPQIISLTGLRRVGKTTLMHKIVKDAIGGGADPKTILYFSFDEFRESQIRTVLGEYEKLTGAEVGHGKHIVLLDEIQKLEGWENQLKGIYDAFGKNTKFVISGSESLFIRRESKETLAGRIYEFKVEALSYREFLSFVGAALEPARLYEKEHGRLFESFTHTAGFPELIGVSDRDIQKKYLKENIIEKVIYRDISRLVGVRDAPAVESLMNILMDEPGQLVELSELSRELGISRQTLSKYLAYLGDSFLVRKLYNYSRNRRKVERKLKKYYPAVVSAELLFKEDDYSKSKVFEWLLVNQLRAEFFWRDPRKNEVDIVLAEDSPVPVEVKYGKIDVSGVLEFSKKQKIAGGFIVTREEEGVHRIGGKAIRLVPAYKFLLEHAPKYY